MARQKTTKRILSRRSGDYGKRMIRCFTVFKLSDVRFNGRAGFIGTRELAILSGVPYRSLTRCLPEWVSKGYIEMRSAQANNVGDYEYRICAPGESWLHDARLWLPRYNEFRESLLVWLRCITKPRNYNVLHDAKFNTMVHCIDALLKRVPVQDMPYKYLRYDGDVIVIEDTRNVS